MVATAPGEKLPLIGRRPVRNWTQLQLFSFIHCFCAENYICSQENQRKLLPPELHFLTPIYCTKSFVRYPTRGAYNAPPDSLAVFRGPTFKGRGRKGWRREGKGEGREEERGGDGEGVRPLS